MQDRIFRLTWIGKGYIVKFQIATSRSFRDPILIWIDGNRHIHDFLQPLARDRCPWIHSKETGQEKEGQKGMETVLDKGNQIPDFQLATTQWLEGKPDNGHNHSNNDLHKERLRQTCQFKETVGIVRIDFIFISEALFLKILTGKGSNDP